MGRTTAPCPGHLPEVVDTPPLATLQVWTPGLWAACFSWRCPFQPQGVWTRRLLKVPSNRKYSRIIFSNRLIKLLRKVLNQDSVAGGDQRTLASGRMKDNAEICTGQATGDLSHSPWDVGWQAYLVFLSKLSTSVKTPTKIKVNKKVLKWKFLCSHWAVEIRDVVV